MTERQKEVEIRRIVRAINRHNNSWTFNGQRFETAFPFRFDRVVYCVRIINTIGETRAEISLRTIDGENIPPDACSRSASFCGADCYENIVLWIAEESMAIWERVCACEIEQMQSAHRKNVFKTLKAIASDMK